MNRDGYNQAVLEAIGCENEFENDGGPLATAIAQAQAGRDSGDHSLADAAIDRIVAAVAAAPFPARVDRVRPMVPSIQVEIMDADDNEVTDPATALLAMREVLGAPGYESELEDLGDGLWLVSLPADAASELKLNGYWGRESEGGFNVTAEWPS